MKNLGGMKNFILSTEDKYKIVISEKDKKVLKESLTRKYPIIMQSYLL